MNSEAAKHVGFLGLQIGKRDLSPWGRMLWANSSSKFHPMQWVSKEPYPTRMLEKGCMEQAAEKKRTLNSNKASSTARLRKDLLLSKQLSHTHAVASVITHRICRPENSR